MTLVKVCGLMSEQDVAVVNAADVDYAGFVLAGGRHHVDPAQLTHLSRRLKPGIKAVAVVTQVELGQLLALAQLGVIQAVQAHQGATAQQITQLHQAGLQVMARVTDLTPATTADFALVDAGAGSGQVLDWAHLPKVTQPLMLAGGLDAGNVQQAIVAARPQLVDASSRLETNGKKDALKVLAFVQAARKGNG